MAEKFDFRGYATKNDIRCADGRTIRKNAFKDCDGATVPLVWQHGHGKTSDVLGHCLLENCEDGVIAYGSFNETDSGKNAKELVRHGDVKALSIYANQLVQKGGDVLHGMIREVSLCLAGANPGAMIEDLSFEHFDDEDAEFEARIWNGENIEIFHSDDKKKKDEEEKTEEAPKKEEPESEEKKEEKPVANDSKEKTVKDVWDSFTEEQQNVVYYMIGQALEQAGANGEKNESEEEDEKMMKHAYMGTTAQDAAIMHDALNQVLADGETYGSLRKAYAAHMKEGGVLAHAIDTTGMEVPTVSNTDYATNTGYGVNGIEFLYPEAHNLNPEPEFIGRDMDWVKVVWGEIKRTPYSRLRTTFANITEDEARAKGYIKGNLKKEEFFSLMKRVTVPQTVYKKQKVDRDDVLDITDFNYVAWLHGEMRMMLNEEIARAILIGDGRSTLDGDKISEEHIRPIASDKPIFSVQKTVTRGADESATAKNFIREVIKSRKDYKGSGNPTLFTTEDMLTSMLLIEDGLGHNIYKSEAELATALRVAKIVTVPVMEGVTLANDNELLGIVVNLRDYNVGTDKKGEITMFDDFDIDYNQYKYLIETRCSGTLVKPFSAIVLSIAAA